MDRGTYFIMEAGGLNQHVLNFFDFIASMYRVYVPIFKV